MRITPTNNEKFIKSVTNAILEMGGFKVNDLISSFRTFEIETIVGKLRINIDTDNISCYTLFCRFTDVDRAKEVFDCNPYSGKYNAHINIAPIKDVIETAINHIKITQP